MTAGVAGNPTRRRRLGRGLAVAGAAASTVLASACAAGQYAQSSTAIETLDGTTVRIGTTITLGGLAIETPGDGISWAAGSNVPVKVVIVNSGQQADRLTSITSPSITGWTTYANAAAASAYLAPAGSPSAASPSQSQSSGPSSQTSGASPSNPVAVEAHSAVQFGSSATGATNRVLLLSGLKGSLTPGATVALTFTFARAGSVTAKVPVQLTRDARSSVIPGPPATGQAG